MAKASAPDSFFPTSLVPPEAVRDYCDRTVRKAAELSRSILTSMSQNVDGNFDLAAKLIRCNDPSEAMTAWKDWATARRDALLADSKGLASQWLQLCDIDMEMMTTAARRATEHATNVSTMPRAAAGD
jgi:phasin protein